MFYMADGVTVDRLQFKCKMRWVHMSQYHLFPMARFYILNKIFKIKKKKSRLLFIADDFVNRFGNLNLLLKIISSPTARFLISSAI